MITIKATIFFENLFWVGTFERTDKEGFAVAKKIFGAEPSNEEVHDYILHHFLELNFGEPKEFKLTIKKINPKRMQREIKKEMELLKKTQRPSTLAQDYMREELEKNKLVRKKVSRELKHEKEQQKFIQKQVKKKKKKKGH